MNKFQQITDKLISPMSERDRMLATLGLWASWGSTLCLLPFGALLWIYRFYLPASIWLAWSVFFVIIPFIHIRARRFLAWLITLHLFTVLVVPFAVDYLLGGFSRLGYSGFVILVIIVANIYDRKRIILWTGLSSLALLISILIEPTIAINPLLPQWLAQAWTSGSIIASLWVAALTISHFTRQRDRVLELLAAEKEKLRQMATSDPLTGAHNRRFFFEEGEKFHQLSIRYQHPYSVLMLDLDNFKRVNDTYGHASGDEYLREIVRRLQSGIRNVDILARYGGDEFIILFPETNIGAAFQTAERLLDSLRSRPIEIGEASLTATASLGVAQNNPSQPETFQQTVERADQAAYRAKSLGKKCVVKAE
jgi:diguanylate cyclase (GGDEF)-like protein